MKYEQKIDFVITWVDGNDEEWKKERAFYLSDTGDIRSVRYRDWNLLRYWFRGVEKFAPWINKIHFVTCGHLPKWLNTKHPKLNVVNHKDFIPDKYLPTFNSHTIELNLHRIKGLQNQFVYFNDDVFLINKVNPEDFFQNGLPCDTGVLGCVCPQDDFVSNVIFNNIVIINKYFQKTDFTVKNYKYAFNLRYGKYLLRTILLYPFGKHTGFYDFHLHLSFKKDTFEKLWDKESQVLDSTCKHKFRTSNDVSPWLFRYWQLASCNFVPYNVIGKYFALGNLKLIEYIREKRGKVICCNDVDECVEFDVWQNKLVQAFDGILPDKSSFEK